jgi:hypothetical protein
MTELINAIITATPDKQPTEDQVNAILAQVRHVYCYTGKYALTILYQRKAKKAAQRVRAGNLKAANPTNSGPAQ